jgi:predicted dienelactone hydrolase
LVAATAVAVICAGAYLSLRPATGNAAAGNAASGRAQSARPRSSPRAATTPARPKIGVLRTYRVASAHFTWTRNSAGLGKRVLPVTVRYPVIDGLARYRHRSRGLLPLIVFAPGFQHCAAVYSDLLRQWSSAGYVVAAVDFPRTSCKAKVPDEADVTHQPADLAFVIRRLLARSASGRGRLAGLIAANEVAVAGHSDGGDTAAALAGAPCCRDERVRAAVILSGAQWPAFTGRWFARRSPPLLVIQGTADAWNPPADSVRLYRADVTGPRYYLELPGADHFSPYEGNHTPEPVVARVTVDFLDRYLLGDKGKSAAMRRAGTVAGKAALSRAGRLPA